jgi:hypothetical protein|tara:strand:- start:536 stop:754 length:219 start_codon:yes stop_codon:yes gene_type:complete
MNNKKYTSKSQDVVGLDCILRELNRLSGLMEEFQGNDHFEHDVNGLTVVESLIDQACEKLRETRTSLEKEVA